jgi:hypothetical protein
MFFRSTSFNSAIKKGACNPNDAELVADFKGSKVKNE